MRQLVHRLHRSIGAQPSGPKIPKENQKHDDDDDDDAGDGGHHDHDEEEPDEDAEETRVAGRGRDSEPCMRVLIRCREGRGHSEAAISGPGEFPPSDYLYEVPSFDNPRTVRRPGP